MKSKEFIKEAPNLSDKMSYVKIMMPKGKKRIDDEVLRKEVLANAKKLADERGIRFPRPVVFGDYKVSFSIGFKSRDMRNCIVAAAESMGLKYVIAERRI